jgi:Zn-dependent metalloprotease
VKLLQQTLGLVLLASALAAVPATQAAAAGQPAAATDDSLVQQMRTEADGGISVSNEKATGRVDFVGARGATGDLLPDVEGDTTAKAVAKAAAYLERFGAAFGADPDQLTQTSIKRDPYGSTVTYAQHYEGVEVFGAALRAHLDPSGNLTSVNGFAAPGLSLDVTPQLSESDAASRAVEIVAESTDGATGLDSASTELVIYRLGSTRGVDGPAVLTWVVEVTNSADVREKVFLDARTGKVVNRFSMMAHALDRRLIEASLDDRGTPTNPQDDTVELTEVWREGQPTGNLNSAQLDLHDGTGEAYWLFKNAFNYDSYDGRGATMITVNNDPRIDCPNASWNGISTNYCDGVTSDDTVAHEWAHAYTEHTSDLIYQWQSGAMNEAYSDIWGETVDQLNDRYNETPAGPRTAACSKYTRGAVSFRINSPASIAGPCNAVPASFGPVIDAAGKTADLVVGQDSASGGGTATDGCSSFTNAAAISGKFVYVDRGLCALADKAVNAAAAGATGIVVGNNVAGEAPFSMTGSTNIYGVMIGMADGQRIKSAATPVNVTVKAGSAGARDDSYRWLSGEGDPAFGGAIRDMWNPTCYGDPGKVSDAEYKCSTDDGGGVHSNSGVVNHAWALLVDGGTYNGRTVPKLGLDKSAAIFWRTQTEYLFPIADFGDLASGLAESCADLVGRPINKLTLQPNATPTPATPVTASDCAAVAAAIDAVELELDPTRKCGFKPLLAKNTPGLCGRGFRTELHWKENFDDGLKGWKRSEKAVYPGARGIPWRAAKGTSVPGGHRSGVAYAPDPDEAGDCSEGKADVSSRNSLTSPMFVMPDGKTPRLSFDHYVATEHGYDGGIVSYRVRGGEFRRVPTSAYLFNRPGARMAGDGTGPLAGQPAFTGTDGGKTTGSWGTSRIDLRKLAEPGQRLQLRFDFGIDGCGGVDGWYLDNLKVATCQPKARRRT